MTNSIIEINVACNYLLRLIKPHIQLTNEQINLFKRVFYETLSKRFVGHWFPATPHRGSAYRCLQTKHWKDPVLKSIGERSGLPLHRCLPPVFTLWIDPGEVAVCFGDDGTWCSLYKQDIDGQILQEYSDGEETVSSFSSDDDLLSLTREVKTMNMNDPTHFPNKQISIDSDHSRSSSSLGENSRASSPYFNSRANDIMTQLQSMNNDEYSESFQFYSGLSMSNDWNQQQHYFWPTLHTVSDSLLLYNQEENF